MKTFLKHYGYSVFLCLSFGWLLALGQSVTLYAQDDPGNGSISGVVTNAQDSGVPSIYVTSYQKVGEAGNISLQPVSAVLTDEQGVYTMTNLFAGTYQLAFEDTRLPPLYANEFYDNVASWPAATDISVGISENVTGIDATIGKLGQITGTVTNGAGAPLADIFVVPFKIPDDGQQFNGAITDSSGTYTVTGLAAGVYGLRFEALPQLPYQSEYYDNVFTLAEAQGITVAVDATVANINAQLGKRGRLQGVVTDENGNALPNINVSLVYSDTQSDAWQPANTVTTAADGSYAAEVWNPGVYRVEFLDQHNPQRYQNEYYDSSAAFETATDLPVTVDAVVSGVDASLAAIDLPGAVISGTVTDNTGNPLGLIHVLAYRVEDATPESGSWPVASDDFTNDRGHYKLIGLLPGTYRVEFRDDGPQQKYAGEFYDNAAAIDNATDLPVAENALVAGIDAQLGERGSIRGHVTDLAGNPPAPPDSVFVFLYRQSPGTEQWNYLYGVHLDASATYTFPNLEPGVYRVGFQNATGYYQFNPEYYNNAGEFSGATAIVVALDSHVTGIDAQLGPRGRIEGKLTDSAGTPLAGIPVHLYAWIPGTDGGSWQQQGTIASAEDGVYRWGDLRYGAYRLQFAGSSAYFPQFYQDAPTLEAATTLSITKAASFLTGIDAQLATKGYLTGQITNKQGEPLAGIKVQVYVPQATGNGSIFWNFVKQGETDGAGVYKLYDLPSGIVRLGFVDESNHYVFEYYDDARTVETATDIAVSATAVITINAQLATFGRITGTVLSEAGQPLAGITVLLHQEALLSDGSTYWAQYQNTPTDANGDYAFTQLLGRYRVSFADQRTFPGEYRYEFYNDVATLEAATDLLIPPGVEFTDIDAKLTQLGRIRGVVTNEQGEPLPGVGVTVFYDPAGNGGWQPHLANATTDQTGAYTLSSLESGAYRLFFSEQAAIHRYSAAYYENAATFPAATTIPVTIGMTTTIDVTLAPTGGISGSVTGPAGQPLPGMLVVLWGDRDGNGQWERTNQVAAPVDANGVYTFTGVDVGAYRVSFHDPTQLLYAPEFYDDAPTIDGATNVTVTAGVITPRIDAQLGYYSHITGTVTDETGAPLTNIFVTVYAWRPDQFGAFGRQEVNSRYTNNEGHYKVGGLTTGVYRVRFADTFNNLRHTEYYDDAGYIDTAADIAIGAAMTVTNINAQLAPFTAVNYPPLAHDDEAQVLEGGTTNTVQFGDISLLANDRDAEFMPITPTLVTSPAHGVVTVLATGLFTYTHNGNNATSDHFTYKVNDGVQDSTVATVTITITPTNDAPLAVNDRYTLTSGAILTGSNVLVNDSDEESTILTATLVTSPTHGALTLAANGRFTYTHDASAAITDTFAYVASDGITTSNVATVNLIISPTTPLVSFTLSKTVGVDGVKPLCTAQGAMKVPVGTAVVYCYTVRNTGSTPLTTHSLVDSDLGQLLDNVTYALAPGAAYSVTFTKTLTVSITNVATWTATIADIGQAIQRTIPGATGATGAAATVLISGPTDDQDGDTIPDNLEGWRDPDGDNLPNFLDTDADGDGKSDQAEVGDPTKPTDSDKDGIPDFLDNDGSVPSLNLKQFLPLIHR